MNYYQEFFNFLLSKLDDTNFYKKVGDDFDLFSTKCEFLSEYEKKDYFSKLKKEPANRSLLYYLENKIEYQLNNYGFRTPDDFEETQEVNIYLGCSDTFGYGIHFDNMWSTKLHKSISTSSEKFWNLSVPGGNTETDFRVLFYFIKKYKPKIKNIFHLCQIRYRHEVVLNHNPFFKTVTPFSIEDDVKDRIIKNTLLDDNYNYLKILKNINLIDTLAQNNFSNYYLINNEIIMDKYFSFEHEMREYSNDLYDNSLEFLKARDLGHPGYGFNHRIFHYFLLMYNNINLKSKYI